jgi:hypothetical protein
VRSLKVTEANRAWAGNYSREFRAWIKRHGFDKMPAATRSVAVELHEHAEAITSWRDGLPERQRRRLIHPLSVTRRWRAARQAWARFCACTKASPAGEAAPLWRLIAAEATIHIS